MSDKKVSLVTRIMKRMGICVDCGRKAANETGYCEDCYNGEIPKCKKCDSETHPCGSSIDADGNYVCFDCDKEINELIKGANE